MKKITISMMALSTMFLISCGGEEKKEDANTTETSSENQAVVEETPVSGMYNVSEGSIVNWDAKHYKDADYVHHGTINVSEGTINVENGVVTGGDFTFDMKSIVEPGTDTTKPWTLQGHFKAPEFFNVDEFATSSFAVKNVTDGTIQGDLTILGIAKEITFPAEINITNENLTATADFTVDLLQFDIPILVEGETLPEEEKMEGANPVAHFHFELSAGKAAQ